MSESFVRSAQAEVNDRQNQATGFPPKTRGNDGVFGQEGEQDLRHSREGGNPASAEAHSTQAEVST